MSTPLFKVLRSIASVSESSFKETLSQLYEVSIRPALSLMLHLVGFFLTVIH